MEQSPNNTYQVIALLKQYFSHQYVILYKTRNLDFPIVLKISNSKVGDFSRGRPEGSLFDSYYTEV